MQSLFNAITIRSNGYSHNQVAATNVSDPPKATPSTDLTLPMAATNGSPLVAVASEIPTVEASNPHLINLDTAIRICNPPSEYPREFFFEICLPMSIVINSISFISGITSITIGFTNLGTGLCLKGCCGAMGNLKQCSGSGPIDLGKEPYHMLNIDSCALTYFVLATDTCISSIHARVIELRNNIEERHPPAEVTAAPEATAT